MYLYRVSKIKGSAKSAESAPSSHAFDFKFFFQLIIKFYTIIYKNMSLKVCRHPAFGREFCTAPLKTSSMTTHKRRQWLQASFCALLHRCCLHGFSATQWGQSTVFHRAVLEFLPLIWWTADWTCRAEYAALKSRSGPVQGQNRDFPV